MNISTIVNTKENPVNVVSTKRQNVIKKVRGLSLVANDNRYFLMDCDVSEYLFVYAVVMTEESHHFELEMFPTFLDKTDIVQKFPSTTIIDTTDVSARTDWIETYSDVIRMNIINDDTNSHTYDITIFGVR